MMLIGGAQKLASWPCGAVHPYATTAEKGVGNTGVFVGVPSMQQNSVFIGSTRTLAVGLCNSCTAGLVLMLSRRFAWRCRSNRLHAGNTYLVRRACSRKAVPKTSSDSRSAQVSSSLTQAASDADASPSNDGDSIIKAVVTASALFMAVWVFVLPGSMWVGMLPERDSFMENTYVDVAGFVAPSSLIYKYSRLGQTVGLTHALPGAIWAILAPCQLSSDVRNVAGGSLHKVLGRLMLTAAAVLMVGYSIIDSNQLYADHVDFSDHGGGLAAAADEFNAQSLGGILPPFNIGGLYMLAAWFTFTGVQTFVTSAITRDIRAHRIWAMRHVAAGLWVAAQRPLFALVRILQGLALGANAASSPELMADAFYYCGYVATLVYILTAEWAVQRNQVVKTSTSL